MKNIINELILKYEEEAKADFKLSFNMSRTFKERLECEIRGDVLRNIINQLKIYNSTIELKKFKILKHKTLKNTFGIISEFYDENGDYSVPEGIRLENTEDEPDLFDDTETMESLKKLLDGQLSNIEELDNYDLIECELHYEE